ncbi:uncharacterized protein LOC126847198 isoform X7 [Adelges cooleyi]|uniref:uncharacterized protein LOC126847198 isoform X7 n=1 Tax=Adelges cooleyi TaxID=133065 RepID=UPI00217FB857|nr:uncharacterized protein LOC126847198 isoform X7 [Adelges cooleyi]
MNLSCILITFVLVNVSATDEAIYKMEVFITNEMIEFAYNKNDLIVEEYSGANGLEYVIEKIVNDEASFAKINLMIAIPGNNITGIDPELEHLHACLILLKCKQYQNIMQNVIGSTLDIAYPVVPYGQDLRRLNLTTLGGQRRHYVKKALKNIFKRKLGSMYDQFIFQLKIRDTSNRKRLNLSTLIERRRVTGTSIESSIRHVLGTDIADVNQDQIRSVHGVSLLRMCRLMGIYLSTRFPTSYIRQLWIDPINMTCTLDEGDIQRRFKQTNGVWWQIRSTTSEAVLT